MPIDVLPVWLLFFLTIGLVVISVEIGFRLGRTVRRKTKDEREAPASSISGVILGLQAFLLAFTFSIVSDRYDTKKSLVREEANVIRTTWNRADFLPEPDRAKAKALLQEYLERRIAVMHSRDLGSARDAGAYSLGIQRQLWDMAVVHSRTDMNSDIGAQYLESLNEVASLHALRVGIGLQSRLPTAIWVALLSLLTLGMMGLGYHCALADSRRSRVVPFLAIAFSLVVALIASLDYPGNKIMPVSQQALETVLSEMKTVSGSGQ
ncbi:MAG TPA: hypothetical protein VJU86_05740 [Pyrinomonadaceae bacterium]|nr:hypothetical protein [Pyrinomonadaceae bacterium]